jgi:hypothetical protein
LFEVAVDQLDDYASQVVERLERYGVTITDPAPGEDLEILEADDGDLSFGVTGSLPDGRRPPLSTVEIRERFVPRPGNRLERADYEYELIDHERDFRRAFHMHNADWFQHRYLVVVHEHCEQPVGLISCPHYQGTPVRDGFAGVEALVEAWTGPVPDCRSLRCLDT